MFSTCSVVYSAFNLVPRDSLFKLSLGFCSLLESCPHPLLLRVTCVVGSWVLCPWVASNHSQIQYTVVMVNSTMTEFHTILASILGGMTLRAEAQVSSMRQPKVDTKDKPPHTEALRGRGEVGLN